VIRRPGGHGRLLLAVLVVASLVAATTVVALRPIGSDARLSAPAIAPGTAESNARLATAAVGDELTPPSFPAGRPTHSGASTPTAGAQGSVRLMVVGDVMLARSIGRAVERHGSGIVFRGVADLLSAADLVAVNLECSIATTGTPAHKHFTFRAPPLSADALVLAGVDVAGQANNHALDFGPAALAETRSILARQGIAVAGAGPDRASAHAPVILERSGLRIAFLAYVAAFPEKSGFNTKSWAAGKSTPGVAIARASVIRADVRAALRQADLVAVMLHAGIEGSSTPIAIQRHLARAAIGAGATLVVGAHPHVLQGYALHAGRLIAYGMGNFVFDKTRGIGADSAILDVTLTRDGVSQLRWIPVLIHDGFPTLARGTDARRIRNRLQPI
jgi:poly-gamma-glutamate capsule biosynthesis protein CapA/YwtB (metallophosphatase superfamily)